MAPDRQSDVAERTDVPTNAIVRLDAGLPSLTDAEQSVWHLIANGEGQVLDEAHRQIEAAALYEARSGNEANAVQYCKMRLLAEAGLGVLSFADRDAVPSAHRRGVWRVLAAAFERGQLLYECDLIAHRAPKDLHSAASVAHRLRNKGFTTVPSEALGIEVDPEIRNESTRWATAREVAREKGIALTKLPTDPAEVARQRDRGAEHHRYMVKLHQDAAKHRRRQTRQLLATSARNSGPRLDVAYGLLRRTLQALQDARGELSVFASKSAIDDALHYLHMAEDEIGNALRAEVGEAA